MTRFVSQECPAHKAPGKVGEEFYDPHVSLHVGARGKGYPSIFAESIHGVVVCKFLVILRNKSRTWLFFLFMGEFFKRWGVVRWIKVFDQGYEVG